MVGRARRVPVEELAGRRAAEMTEGPARRELVSSDGYKGSLGAYKFLRGHDGGSELDKEAVWDDIDGWG